MFPMEKIIEMLENRLCAIAELNKAAGVRRQIEDDIAREIFDAGLHEFVTVDWRRLSRHYGLPERPGR